MAVPERNGRPLIEVFSKSKKEFEEDIRRDTLEFWPGIEVFLDQDDIAFSGDWSPIVYDETPSTAPSEEETTIKPLEKSTNLKPLEKEPKRSVENGAVMRPVETERTPKPFDKKPAFRAVIPFDNFDPSRPAVKWPPFEKFPTMRPFEPLAPIKPINKWELEDTRVNWNWDSPKYKFVFEHPTPPPVTAAAHTGAVVGMKVIGGAVGFVLALLVISTLLDKKNRTRRGVVLAAGADQEMLTDRRPFDAGVPEPFKTELPPPYYECAPYVNKCVSEVPPPYTYPEHGAPQDHKQRQGVFIENELHACSEEGAPDMKTELVFDNGRIVERLSLDLNSNDNATGAVGNDNVEEQNTRHDVDETGHVKGNGQ